MIPWACRRPIKYGITFLKSLRRGFLSPIVLPYSEFQKPDEEFLEYNLDSNNMKIAFLVNRFPCLSETFILNQITGLIDRGHQVDIFAGKSGDDPKLHDDIRKYKLLNQTYYQSIPINKFERLMKGLNLIILNLPKRPLAILKSLNVLAFGRKAASLSILYESVRFLNKGHYDIIHCHFGPLGNVGAILKDIGVIKGKIVTTFHGFDMSRHIKKSGHNVYDHLFKHGDLFLPISERWKGELVRLGCDEQRIIVHRMGIDTNKFLFSPRKPRGNGQVHFLTIARLVEKKGVQYGVQAVAKLIRKYPQIMYKIIGDGPLKTETEKLINSLNMNNNIKLLGWKQQEEIIEIMREADILLAPSVTSINGDQEGIPVVIMEAMAMGLPVVSTLHSGIPELVQDGISGFLVPERDVNGLAEKLKYLIEHQEIWPDMGKAGRRYVEENYDIHKLNDRLVRLYRQLLDGKL
jgi:colanic acid/amylovoran biosynthesis glycosyltransferase